MANVLLEESTELLDEIRIGFGKGLLRGGVDDPTHLVSSQEQFATDFRKLSLNADKRSSCDPLHDRIKIGGFRCGRPPTDS